MFELFIALFGGLFYALKIGGDRAGTKEYDRQTMERRAFHDARWGKWQAAVASVGLEDEVKQSIQCLQKKDRRIDVFWLDKKRLLCYIFDKREGVTQ